MLRIAVIGEFRSTRDFIRSKYNDQIVDVNFQKGEYTIANGDTLIQVYGNYNVYLSGTFHAMIPVDNVHPELVHVIQHRIDRSWINR